MSFPRTLFFILPIALAGAVPRPSFAQAPAPIYMCVDEHGRRTATNVRSEMKGKKCERQVDGTLPAPKGAPPAEKRTAPPSPPDFPKVGAEAQKARDGIRQQVLAEELASEQKLLDKAKQELAEGNAPRSGEDRSSPKRLDRISELEKAVQRHQKNVESLRREIGTLK
jgi:hypothetical protein